MCKWSQVCPQQSGHVVRGALGVFKARLACPGAAHFSRAPCCLLVGTGHLWWQLGRTHIDTGAHARAHVYISFHIHRVNGQPRFSSLPPPGATSTGSFLASSFPYLPLALSCAQNLAPFHCVCDSWTTSPYVTPPDPPELQHLSQRPAQAPTLRQHRPCTDPLLPGVLTPAGPSSLTPAHHMQGLAPNPRPQCPLWAPCSPSPCPGLPILLPVPRSMETPVVFGHNAWLFLHTDLILQ